MIGGTNPAALAARVRPTASVDLSPPVAPNLPRRDVPGAKDVGRNTLETLLFRGLSTPIALGLVVLQSRFLEPEGRGAFVIAVLGVTIFSRLLGQLGVAVVSRMAERRGSAASPPSLAWVSSDAAVGSSRCRIATDDLDARCVLPHSRSCRTCRHTCLASLLVLARVRLELHPDPAARADGRRLPCSS